MVYVIVDLIFIVVMILVQSQPQTQLCCRFYNIKMTRATTKANKDIEHESYFYFSDFHLRTPIYTFSSYGKSL